MEQKHLQKLKFLNQEGKKYQQKHMSFIKNISKEQSDDLYH